MLLCMDENGNIYQASRDREDGRGYQKSIESVSVQDVFLENASLEANKDIQKSWESLAKANLLIDEQDMKNKKISQDLGRINNLSKQLRLKRESNPLVKQKMIEDGAIQYINGADFSQHNVWSGSSGLYSNGLGRTKNEKLVDLAYLQHNTKLGEGDVSIQIAEDVPLVDNDEMKQYLLEKEFKEEQLNKGNQLAVLSDKTDETKSVTEVIKEPKSSKIDPEKIIKNLGYGLLLIAGLNLLKKKA